MFRTALDNYNIYLSPRIPTSPTDNTMSNPNAGGGTQDVDDSFNYLFNDADKIDWENQREKDIATYGEDAIMWDEDIYGEDHYQPKPLDELTSLDAQQNDVGSPVNTNKIESHALQESEVEKKPASSFGAMPDHEMSHPVPLIPSTSQHSKKSAKEKYAIVPDKEPRPVGNMDQSPEIRALGLVRTEGQAAASTNSPPLTDPSRGAISHAVKANDTEYIYAEMDISWFVDIFAAKSRRTEDPINLTSSAKEAIQRKIDEALTQERYDALQPETKHRQKLLGVELSGHGGFDHWLLSREFGDGKWEKQLWEDIELLRGPRFQLAEVANWIAAEFYGSPYKVTTALPRPQKDELSVYDDDYDLSNVIDRTYHLTVFLDPSGIRYNAAEPGSSVTYPTRPAAISPDAIKRLDDLLKGRGIKLLARNGLNKNANRTGRQRRLANAERREPKRPLREFGDLRAGPKISIELPFRGRNPLPSQDKAFTAAREILGHHARLPTTHAHPQHTQRALAERIRKPPSRKPKEDARSHGRPSTRETFDKPYRLRHDRRAPGSRIAKPSNKQHWHKTWKRAQGPKSRLEREHEPARPFRRSGVTTRSLSKAAKHD